MINFKQTLQTAIPGWNGKALAHMMGWFGEGNPVKVHRQSRYASNYQQTIATQLNIMQDAGIDGVIVTWQGPFVNTFLHDATMKIWEACLWRQMQFGLLLDPWIAKGQSAPTTAVINALQHTDTQRMLASPCYLPERYILEFDLANAASVDIVKVQTTFNGTPLLSWHTGFSWPNIPVNAANPSDSLASLKSDNAKPTMKVAGVNIMFNDGGYVPSSTTAATFNGQRNYSTSVWNNGPTHVIDHQAGNWFYDQLAVTPALIPYIALVTWNDHDEGTGIEHVVSALSGMRIL